MVKIIKKILKTIKYYFIYMIEYFISYFVVEKKLIKNIYQIEKIKSKTLCIFSHYDRDSTISEYVIYYLQELKKLNIDIIFISTSINLNQEEFNKIKDLSYKVIHKKNIGRDIGAYYSGIINEDLNNFDKLILVNDSVYGPLFDFKNIFEEMNKRDLDLWGMSDSYDISYHIQSYFLVINKRVLTSKEFIEFWKKYRYFDYKDIIINRYEVGFSKYLIKKGFKVGAYCEYKKVLNELYFDFFNSQKPLIKSNIFYLMLNNNLNQTHFLWNTLILKYNFTFIKIELLRDNPEKIDNLDLLKDVITKSNYNYELITKHLYKMHKNLLER